MSNVTTTSRPKATVEAATQPLVYNVSLLLANTEYSQALSSSVKRFTIRVRGDANLRLAFNVGETATNYFTIPKGCSLTEEGLDFGGTIYIRSSLATQIVEILEWT